VISREPAGESIVHRLSGGVIDLVVALVVVAALEGL
jgi:hypothetical protein